MKPSLFRSGLGPRVAVVAAFAILAFAAVAALEQRAPQRTAGKTDTGSSNEAPTAPATMSIESIQRVATWSVHINGMAITPRATTSTTWIAEVALSDSAGLVVEATQVPGAEAARNALRIRIAGTARSRDHTVWCTRDWSVASRISELSATRTPLDPADLP